MNAVTRILLLMIITPIMDTDKEGKSISIIRICYNIVKQKKNKRNEVHVNGNYLIRRICYSLILKNFTLDFIDVNYIL